MNEARSWIYGWIASACSAAVFVSSIALPHRSPLPLKVMGLVLLALSVPLMFVPILYLARHGEVSKGRPYYETTSVVASGPFRLIRHPQYLGYVLLISGFAATWYSQLSAALAFVGSVFFYLQMLAEDRRCLRRFGSRYQEYARRVPRCNIVVGAIRMLRG